MDQERGAYSSELRITYGQGDEERLHHEWLTHVSPWERPDDSLHAGSRLLVSALGGGLREGPGLEGYAAGELASGGRGQILAPWPNRLRGGRWSWRGRDLQLAVSEPSTGCAIHGLVRWSTWQQVQNLPREAVTAVLARSAPGGSEDAYTTHLQHVVAPRPGYPFCLGLTATYEQPSLHDPDSWSVTHTATNLSAEPAPFGLGQHPYLTAGTTLVDDAELTVRARVQLEADDVGLPTGERASDGWSGRIGAAVLDTTFTDLARGSDGRAEVVLRGPEQTVTWWADEAYGWVQVFSGDTLAPERRRRGLAVEPMTCPPDALASGRDLVVLEPGETWSGSWGVRVS